MKRCTKCGEWKEESEYGKNGKTRDGIGSRCKACKAQYQKEYCENNKEKVKERARLYRLTRLEELREVSRKYHQDHRDEINARHRKWQTDNKEYILNKRIQKRDVANEKQRRRYGENKEEINARHRKYYADNREKINAKHKEYRDANPDKGRAKCNRYRTRKQGGGGKYEQKDIDLQLKNQNFVCYWCNEPFDESDIRTRQTVDHRIPISRGGDNNPGNIVIAHHSCNSSKRDKMPWEYCGRLL